jgi:hypothetical protein
VTGGAVTVNGSTLTLVNCTLAGNSAPSGGGVFLTTGPNGAPPASATITNSIVHGNPGGPIATASGASATVSRSVVEGGWSGPGGFNISGDPLFVNPAADDFSLRPHSPCIDAGDSTAVPGGVLADLNGDPRFRDDTGTPDSGIPGGAGATVDMGACEFQGTSCYANCDRSTFFPILNVSDFACFLNAFAAADPLANCDNSTVAPTLNVSDFSCFLNAFAAGCT